MRTSLRSLDEATRKSILEDNMDRITRHLAHLLLANKKILIKPEVLSSIMSLEINLGDLIEVIKEDY